MATDKLLPSAGTGASILAHLQQVEAERAARAADPDWSGRVAALKAYQHARFARTHADLLADRRHAAAAGFFLDDLYGPQDFADRDAQFARIVPALVRLFPAEVVATVDSLAALHALSESLDSQMARSLPGPAIDSSIYQRAWQATGRRADRRRQIELVVILGQQLEHYTRNRWLGRSLRLMRGPARAAGLGSLQAFLERGFDTFADLNRHAGGTAEFMNRIETREFELMNALFDTEAVAGATTRPGPLGQLP
jgi:hypothetical protein